MIRKVLMSSVAIVAITGSAFAADLPSRRAPPVYVPPPVPLFSWTGFYLGGQVGFAYGRDRSTQVYNSGYSPSYNVGSPNGIIGGVHGGYNFSTQSVPVLGQFAGAFSGLPIIGGFGGVGGVVGIEADVNGADYRGNVALFNAFTEQDRMQLNGSVRGRVGIAVDRALFYATGGVAIARFDSNYAIGNFANYTPAHTRIGYTVGGGMEYAVTTQLSLRGEYRYSDYGRYTDITGINPRVPYNTNKHQEVQQVQVGFSYKFESPVAAPVVARY